MRPQAPSTTGALVLVVGPSGAGKDSILGYARQQLTSDSRFVFARRLITRHDADPTEEHEACTEAAFAAEEASGTLVVSWRAHGTGYGIRRTILQPLAEGRVVIANVSRRVIDQGAALAARVTIAHITASPAVLAARLRLRGRETHDEIVARLAREAPLPPHTGALVTIGNDGPLAEGGGEFVALLREEARRSSERGAGDDAKPAV